MIRSKHLIPKVRNVSAVLIDQSTPEGEAVSKVKKERHSQLDWESLRSFLSLHERFHILRQ